jgi:hypothetical protein
MGHHLTADGQFKSDRHPDLPAGKIVLSFRDPCAQRGLWVVAVDSMSNDPELAEDMLEALRRQQGFSATKETHQSLSRDLAANRPDADATAQAVDELRRAAVAQIRRAVVALILPAGPASVDEPVRDLADAIEALADLQRSRESAPSPGTNGHGSFAEGWQAGRAVAALACTRVAHQHVVAGRGSAASGADDCRAAVIALKPPPGIAEPAPVAAPFPVAIVANAAPLELTPPPEPQPCPTCGQPMFSWRAPRHGRPDVAHYSCPWCQDPRTLALRAELARTKLGINP